MLKKAIVSVAALSLAASPVVAASSLSVAPQRAAASIEDDSDMRGRPTIVPVLIGVGVILLILYLTDTWPFGDDPDSP